MILASRAPRLMTRQRGFALLTVLWVLAGMAILAMLSTFAARESIGAARNRVSITRAEWEAEGCAERARGVIELALLAADDPETAWTALDRHVAAASMGDCRVILRPGGRTLNVNTVNGGQLRFLLQETGISPVRSDSIADAVIDWMDEDDIPLSNGAEAGWYVARGRVPPRNAPFQDARELHLVRGLESLNGLDTLLGVHDDRTTLSHAPHAVLSALPGLGPEMADIVLHLRGLDRKISLEALGNALSGPIRERFVEHQAALATVSTISPDAWVVSSSASSGVPSVSVRLELRIVRSGRRAAVMGRRIHRWT